MKENIYDNEDFFKQYSLMSRSLEGLRAAGEWHILQSLLPNMSAMRVLDLGCGYGWHAIYAVEHGAKYVLGVDLSEKMIAKAVEINSNPKIDYLVGSVEDFDYSKHEKFDIVLSSLTLHYVESFENVCRDVAQCLASGGQFIFSVEHPIFTSYGTQQWYLDQNGTAIHWPVDRYFSEGQRVASFLGTDVVKYHKTLTTYVQSLIEAGFEIVDLVEPQPSQEMLDSVEGMSDELRRPMMLIISARKK